MQSLPQCEPWAYADDTVIATPPAVALEYLQAWEDKLALPGWPSIGTHLEPTLPLLRGIATRFPTAMIIAEGFRVCGLPLDYVDMADPHDFTPLGTGPFIQNFLAEA